LKSQLSQDLLKRSKAESNKRKAIRLLALSHFYDGKNRAEIARYLKVSRRSVNDWVSAYLEHGVTGLESKKPPGRSSYLTSIEKEKLSQYIVECSSSTGGGRLTGECIRQYIKREFGVTYHLNSVYKLLKTLGFTWQTSRSRHPKQCLETQNEFKKS
jgi:transposase